MQRRVLDGSIRDNGCCTVHRLLGELPGATAELAGGQQAGVPHSGGAAAAAGQAGARRIEHPKRGSSQNTTDVTAVAAGCSEARQQLERG